MRGSVTGTKGSRGQGTIVYSITGGVYWSMKEAEVGRVAVDGGNGHGCDHFNGKGYGGQGDYAIHGLAWGWRCAIQRGVTIIPLRSVYVYGIFYFSVSPLS